MNSDLRANLDSPMTHPDFVHHTPSAGELALDDRTALRRVAGLSTELADQKPVFQAELDSHWKALTGELETCLRETDLSRIGLSHLSPAQAADWLMNSWSGALTRMKASRSDEPLALFMRTIFKKEGK